MTPEQQKRTMEYLSKLDVQQLSELLRAELESEETNVDLIRMVNAVLASKTETKEWDVDSSNREFWEEYAGTEPLYDEVLEEMNGKGPAAGKRRIRTRAVLRVGLIAAIIAALLFGSSAAANAMGYNAWGAVARWTGELFGFSVNGSFMTLERDYDTDPLVELRELLAQRGITNEIVPDYIPEGCITEKLEINESFEGLRISCKLSNGSGIIILNYLIAAETPQGQYPKDDSNPERYEAGGIEHQIMSNEGEYFAVWINGNINCTISGVESRAELLKIIDSIYKE